MSPQSLNTSHALLFLLSWVTLGLAGPPRHKHVVRDVPSALTSTQTVDETTYYSQPTESYTSLPPLWPPRPTPHSSTDSASTLSSTTSSPEYPYNTESDTTTTSWTFTPSTTWNFTTPNTTWTGYPVHTTYSNVTTPITHFNVTTPYKTWSTPYFTWSSYSDTWGDHNTYPTPSSAVQDETTTISVIKTFTSFTTTVVSTTVKPLSTKQPSRTLSEPLTFKTTPFANLTTFTSPKWTTVPIASLTGTPFCSNAADPDNGVGNHCVCENGETVGVIPFSKGGNASDYQPCAYTTVGY
ncbi:hypothetical protein QBC45DRAFT_386451 [Copromyces sp. CBS 386.78]|nr:hypothetical protein QBC45DRAFT_386451 [Copromyces sp. CBS 386.78]